jgi:transposase-like protein
MERRKFTRDLKLEAVKLSQERVVTSLGTSLSTLDGVGLTKYAATLL